MARTPDRTGGQDGTPGEPLLSPLDERPGPARRLTSAGSSQLVRSIVDAALAAPLEVPGASPAAPPPEQGRAPRWRRRLAVAAAVLLALSAGTGASAVALRLLHVELGQPELAPDAPPSSHAHPSAPAAPPAPPVEVLPPAAPELAPPAVAPEPERPPAPARRKVRRLAAAPARQHPAAGLVVPENLPPADLLASASERRIQGAWREADAFYGAVVQRFPGTDAAVVAEVASAGLHLQHLGDPAGALAAFHRTLAARPTGPLAEEARWGIAEAHRALGEAGAEARALADFLARHPRSALAPAARHRLERLQP